MKFAYKFVTFLFFAISFVIIVNIGALWYFSNLYFSEYIQETKETKKMEDLDANLLGSVIANEGLDENALEEYRATIKDLSSISDSLEKFSKDPEAYVTIPDSSTSSGTTISATERISNLLTRILSLRDYPSDSPEWRFANKMLRALSILNLGLVTIVLFASWGWIALAFRPIRSVVEHIEELASKRDYNSIEYEKQDEFYPLVQAINFLSHNLSLQEKIRHDLLSDLSHEIRTPIAAIRCYLEGMQDGVIPMKDSTIQLLFSEIERLIKITNSIIEIEKTEGKRASDLRVEKTNITESLSKIVEEYLPLLASNKQKVDFKMDRQFYAVIDPDLFIQLVHNIFSNFFKYAGKGTTLSIRFSHGTEAFSMVFEDNGRWVPEKDLPFIREKFYQVDKTRTITQESGSGIGLSVIEKIIRLHAWALEIESEEGKFFRIKIRIPKNPIDLVI